jgi:hypothetical protein
MRFITRFLPLALLAALLAAGCGSGSSTVTTTHEPSETERARQSGAEGPSGVTALVCRHPGEDAVLLRVIGVSCAKGKSVAAGWHSNSKCAPAAGQSRSACTVEGYRCLTAVAGRGLAVTCARPQRSIAFLAERG